MRLTRTALSTCLVLVATTMGVPFLATPASAAPGAALTLTPTAARDFGNGGPRLEALLAPGPLTRATDGAVVLFDRTAHQVRRIDPMTGIVSVLAGNGAAIGGCALTDALDAVDVPLGDLAGLWADAAGSVYAQPTSYPSCLPGDLYRLDPVDHRWHLALTNPPQDTSIFRTYSSMTVSSTGDVYAYDTYADVVRKIPAGSAPGAAGEVISGSVYADTILVAPDGTVLLNQGSRVVRVEPEGTVTPLAGTGATPSTMAVDGGAGQPATSVPLTVNALAVSDDSATVYLRTTYGSSSRVQAVPTAGGVLRNVAGPLPSCGLTASCLGAELLVHGSEVLTTSNGLQSFPADGSLPLAPTRYAGLLSSTSPDGTPLSRAYVAGITAFAALPDGALAMAAPSGIRTLTGMTGADVLGTRSSLAAESITAATDGTIFATTRVGGPLTVARISPAGDVTTVAGGGSNPLADGATATSVSLSSVTVAAHPGTGALLLGAGDGVVYSLDGEGTLHQLAATPGSVSGLAVAADGTVYAATTATGLPRLTRITPAGEATELDCTAGCPSTALQLLDNGTLLGTLDSRLVVRAADGTATRPLTRTVGPFTARTDASIVTGAQDGPAGGLLSVTSAVPVPTYTEVPSVTVTPGPGRVTVTVTPQAGVQQHVKVVGTPLLAGVPQSSWTLAEADTDGSGAALSWTPTNLGRTGLIAGRTFRFSVVASEGELAVGTLVSSLAASVDVEPLPDATPPSAPGLTLTPQGADVSLQITLPSDDDVEWVVVRTSDTGAALTGPDSGQLVGYSLGNALLHAVDPLKETSFAAFAVDFSGNASSATGATRAAATLVTGAALSDLGFRAAGGTTQLTWSGASPFALRYTAGTSAPTTPALGTALQLLSGGEGGTSYLPLATGAKAAVSAFTWADWKMTSYTRTSFVVTGGQHSDTLTTTATAVVNPGARPAVGVKLVRSTPLGTRPLVGHQVSLYRRTVGTTAWVLVGGQTTGSTGVLAFSVPTVVAATEYQARWNAFSGAQVLATARTTVRQLVTGTLSASTIRRGTAVYARGTVTPRRAARVYLQRYVSGRWVNLVSALSTSSGAYSLRWVPTTPGAYTLRVLTPATSTLLQGLSPNRALRVT